MLFYYYGFVPNTVLALGHYLTARANQVVRKNVSVKRKQNRYVWDDILYTISTKYLNNKYGDKKTRIKYF